MDPLKELLTNAMHEIRNLRRANEILGAQMQVVEAFSLALGMPRSSNGMAPDIVWALEKKIKELSEDKSQP